MKWKMIRFIDLCFCKTSLFLVLFSNASPHFTTSQKHDFSTYPFVLQKSLNGDMLTQQHHPFSVRAALLWEPARVSWQMNSFMGVTVLPLGVCASSCTSTSLLMQASPRLGARSCRGTGTQRGDAELCVSSGSQDTSQPAPFQTPFKAFPSNKRRFGSQRKMFSNDSWLSNLASTLLQGCWFKCNYKTGLNAAEKIYGWFLS